VQWIHPETIFLKRPFSKGKGVTLGNKVGRLKRNLYKLKLWTNYNTILKHKKYAKGVVVTGLRPKRLISGSPTKHHSAPIADIHIPYLRVHL
jgi:hypothetical protein